MSFDLAYALEIIPAILWASLVTLRIFLASAVLSIVGGFLLAIGMNAGRPVALACRGLIGCVRLSPFLAQLYFFYYVLPVYGLTLPAIWVGIIALSVNLAGYLAIVFRAGFDAVPKGQREAAFALGLSRWQTNLLVLMPQMLKVVVAPVASYMIVLFKTTPYLAIIGVREMLGTAFDRASDSFRYLEPMSVVGVLFLAYCLIIAQVVKTLERKLG